jgi:hypothetical protein
VPAFPRPATLIAIAALVVASCGGAVAARSLTDDASIKNGSIPGTKLTPHTLSGQQINVARLGTVPLPTTLPHRQSLSGLYAVEGIGHVNESTVSFLIPLASAPVAHFIAPGAPPPPQCPGSVADPTASPGNLCVFAFDLASGTTPQGVQPPRSGIPGESPRFRDRPLPASRQRGGLRLRERHLGGHRALTWRAVSRYERASGRACITS